ncbi:MAG: NCS2 family nucleobase:cation symporter [Elusimicrobiota bacterium]|jgi:uracil permease|nr:NCS2 family nucleobase:cation symporter [Elusimicrobiota bacterium]
MLKLVLPVMPEDRLSLKDTFIFSLQQVMACFSATVLVPIIVGLPTNVALFSAGVGTLIYLICTGFKVPQFLGSSFAFIPPLISVSQTFGWGAVSGAIIASGLFYAIVSIIIGKVGLGWLDKVFPAPVIGAVIVSIGMSLLPGTVTATFGGGDPLVFLIGIMTVLIIAFVSTKAKGYFKAIPVLIGLIVGYFIQLIIGSFVPALKIDFSNVISASWISFPFGPGFGKYQFLPVPIITFLIVSLATITEHIGDNYTLSSIVGREFYKDPGLHKTILGDGLASAFAGFTGSVANTSYGESSATQALSKVHSVRIIVGASIIAILLSFCGKFGALVATIPAPVLNGACLALYGAIASSGLRRIVDAGVNFSDSRNLIICSVIMTIGIGGTAFSIGQFSLGGVALATIIGIILNLILPKDKECKNGCCSF